MQYNFSWQFLYWCCCTKTTSAYQPHFRNHVVLPFDSFILLYSCLLINDLWGASIFKLFKQFRLPFDFNIQLLLQHKKKIQNGTVNNLPVNKTSFEKQNKLSAKWLYCTCWLFVHFSLVWKYLLNGKGMGNTNVYLFFKPGSLRPSESPSEPSISTLGVDSIIKA